MSLLLTILMWAGIVIGSIIALIVLSFIAYLIWGMFRGFSPPGVEIDINAPALIGVDTPFEIGVTVRNTLDRERTFHSLDFDNSLLKGFIIKQIDPSARESSSGMGTTAHYYTLPIPARGHVYFKLTCHAVQPGDHSGKVMAYVDAKHMQSTDKVLRIVIR